MWSRGDQLWSRFLSSACGPGNSSRVELSLLANATLEGGSPGEEGEDGYKSYENTTVWLLSTLNCLGVALVFSKGRPFRQPVYKNCKSWAGGRGRGQAGSWDGLRSWSPGG